MTRPDATSPADDHAVTLTIPSDPKYMKLVRGLVASAAEVVGFTRPDVNSVCLAVDEACTNVIKHAYDRDHNRIIELRLTLHPDRLDVAIRDWGRKAKPGEIKPRELHDVRPGGLGVHFIREIMDDVVYDTSHEVGTELRMTKTLRKT